MICAILLAAGSSQRMGVQKLLLPFGGRSVIAHIADQLLASSVDRVYVVVGHQAERVGRELSGSRVTIVTNTQYEDGMLSSVRAGLRSVPEQCLAVLVALGDQPSIRSGLVDRMIQAFAASDKTIFVPVYEGRRGHPVLFSMTHRDDVLQHYDDVGLRGLLLAHPHEVFELPVATASVLSDMDVPQDYLRQLKLREQDKPKASHERGARVTEKKIINGQ
jgi:molybdenum cofactor cytidylyltransferase